MNDCGTLWTSLRDIFFSRRREQRKGKEKKRERD
jgi:hypothetical protein